MGAGVHGDTHIRLRESGRVIGAVTGHGNQLPLRLFFLDQVHLVFGRSLSEKIVNSGFLCNGSGSEWIVASNHDGANTHGAKLGEALAYATFDNVFQVNDAQRTSVFGNHQRCTSRTSNGLHRRPNLRGKMAFIPFEKALNRVSGPLANHPSIKIHARHASGRTERHKFNLAIGKFAAPQPIFFLGQYHDRAALGCLIGQ